MNMAAKLVKNQNTYAVTISPPLRGLKPHIIYDIDRKYINNVLGRMCEHYILYPEFAEGRIHYHGIAINVDNIKRHATQYKLGKLGHTLFKQLKDEDNMAQWMAYCTKEWDITNQVFEYLEEEVEPLTKFRKPIEVLKQQEAQNQFDKYGFSFNIV